MAARAYAAETSVSVERSALADGARARTEVLWINPEAIRPIRRNLFGEVTP